MSSTLDAARRVITWATKNKDFLSLFASACVVVLTLLSLVVSAYSMRIAARSVRLTERNADRSDQRQASSEKRQLLADERQKKALSVSILPILDLRMSLDRYATIIELVNYGVGLAIIKEVHVVGNGYDGPDFFRAFHFEGIVDWKRCKVFSKGRDYYLRAGEAFVLLEIDKDFLWSHRHLRSWITSGSIVEVCHAIHQQLANITMRVKIQNAFEEDVQDFLMDLGRFFPLPGAFEGEPETFGILSASPDDHP